MEEPQCSVTSDDVIELLQMIRDGQTISRHLEFDPATGKLGPRRYSRLDDVVCTDLGQSRGFFGGCFIVNPEKDCITLGDTTKGQINVCSMHISCKSDTYRPGRNYGGIIIYQYNGKLEWRTANNTHCKTGYIVIQDTDSENVKEWKSSEAGVVHGAVYRNAFGESVNDANVVGEGFAIRNGEAKVEEFKVNSGVFNNPKESIHHDHRKRMHELSEHCVRKIVEYWKTAGPCWIRRRNFEVKELLEDFDLKLIQNDCTYEDLAM
jgi:hypothetical protein